MVGTKTICGSLHMGVSSSQRNKSSREQDEKDQWVALQGGGEVRGQLSEHTAQGRPLGWPRLPENKVYAVKDQNQDWETSDPGLYKEKHNL